MSDPTLGTGVNLMTGDDITGEARWFLDTTDVLSVDDDELENLVAFVHKGGMTFLSPILPDLKAIVCTAGSLESHLAILCREAAVPCILATELTGEINDGDHVVLDISDPAVGRILAASAVSA